MPEQTEDRRDALEQRIAQLERIVAISQMLSSTLDLNHLLQLIIQTAAELANTEAASIMLVDERTEELFFAASTGEADQTKLRQIKVPIEGSLAGTVYKTGKPLVSAHTEQDQRHFDGVDRQVQFQTRELLGVPLHVRQRCIGVLEVLNKQAGGSFDTEDIQLMMTLASQAAVAIENARLVARLREANRALADLDQLKSNFISIASHELRTPLMIVLGYAEFLRDRASDETSETLDRVLHSARRLQMVIDQMTNLQYLKTGTAELHKQRFVLQQLIADVCSDWQPLAASKSLTLHFQPPSTPIYVHADFAQITLVMNNLLDNAVAFTPDHGHIEVSIRHLTGAVAVTVTDSGIGIPKPYLNRVFDAFYQVESHLVRHHQGLGLGLAIAKQIIRQHGGRIWAESSEGKGSRFTFTLPLKLGN